MLKSLPVTKPEELWRIGDKIRCCNWGGYTRGDDGDFSLFSWDAYKNFREHTPEFADLAAPQAGNAPLGVRRAGSQAPADTFNGQEVSGNFFRTLGARPWIGRLMPRTTRRAPGHTRSGCGVGQNLEHFSSLAHMGSFIYMYDDKSGFNFSRTLAQMTGKCAVKWLHWFHAVQVLQCSVEGST